MQKIIEKMAEIVEKRIKHYKDDFYKYDIESLNSGESSVYVWAVRSCGTWLMTAENLKNGNSKEMYESLYNSNVSALQRGDKRIHKFFIVDIKNQTVKEVRKDKSYAEICKMF